VMSYICIVRWIEKLSQDSAVNFSSKLVCSLKPPKLVGNSNVITPASPIG
jgi:hypothetical protein